MPTPNQQEAARRLDQIARDKAVREEIREATAAAANLHTPGVGTVAKYATKAIDWLADREQRETVEQLKKVARGESDTLPPEPYEDPTARFGSG
jgi:hypothetical protein